MIYDGENRPVNNAAIYVDGKYRSSSDINGHFIITGLKAKVHFAVSAQKQGFETVQAEAAYTDPSHVLYLRMLSGENLLKGAEDAIGEKRWADAETLLERAEQAGAERDLTRYLKAILACGREDYAGALALLRSVTESQYSAPYVYLFMADICQYHLGSPEQARLHLTRFLELRFDGAVSSRLDKLNAALGPL
jgi:hypothetical protein